jgi:hypothetical protein
MSEKNAPQPTAPADKPAEAIQNAELKEEELNKVTGGAFDGISRLIAVTQAKVDPANN